MNKLAYIDDNLNNLECISLVLKSDFDVDIFQDPDDFLNKYSTCTYKAMLVDIHMPKIDGFSLYEKIIQHPKYNGCPIIFISSDDSDVTRIKSFSLGAVDFLLRQMSPVEMLSRVKSKILFFEKHRTIIEFDDLKLNLTLLKAYHKSEELKLTFLEFKLLCHLLKTYPDPATKEELYEKVWGNEVVLDATIYTHIFNLNSKLTNSDYEVAGTRNKGVSVVKKKVTV